MGHIDPNDLEEEEGADAEGTARADERVAGKAPGSLMSVKIRKRTQGGPALLGETAAPKATPAAPTLPQKDASATPHEADVPPTAEPETASDPISRVARRALSACAPRSQARSASPPPRPPARDTVERTPVSRDSSLREPTTPEQHGDGHEAPVKRDIVAYWTHLRGGRRYPKSSDLDALTVGEYWPNSILIRCRPGSRALEPDKVFVTGESTASSLNSLRSSARVNLSPMMLQWLLSLADEVVREGRPMNDVETFPSVNRVMHYRAIALPFSDDEHAVDHVLCHVGPDS